MGNISRQIKPFEELFEDRTGGNKKIKQSDYLEKGVLPIIDQGQSFIAGYTNDVEAKTNVNLPCLIFGDHTKIFKYIDFPFALGADGVKILQPSKEIFPKYGFYFLNQVKLRGKDGYNRNYKYLKETNVPLPDLQIQQKISSILEQADTARQKRKQANHLTEQFLQSAFLKMFGDPVRNEKGWEIKLVSDFVSKIISGWSIQSEQRKKNNVELGVLKVSAVTYGVFKPEEHKAVSKKSINKKLIHPMKGDVLMTRANTREMVAACCIVDKDYKDLFLSDKHWKIIFKPNLITSEYFRYVILSKSYHEQLANKSTGTSGSMFNISKNKLLESEFPIPQLSLQQKFASLVERVEKLREKQRESESELENLFQALMQKYFG